MNLSVFCPGATYTATTHCALLPTTNATSPAPAASPVTGYETDGPLTDGVATLMMRALFARPSGIWGVGEGLGLPALAPLALTADPLIMRATSDEPAFLYVLPSARVSVAPAGTKSTLGVGDGVGAPGAPFGVDCAEEVAMGCWGGVGKMEIGKTIGAVSPTLSLSAFPLAQNRCYSWSSPRALGGATTLSASAATV